MKNIYTMTICGILVFSFACTKTATGPTPKGVYSYTCYDTLRTPIVKGWFSLQIADSQNVTGEWHFHSLVKRKDIGPQIGDGTLAGSFSNGELWVDLHPNFRDNNFVLRGRYDGNRYFGQWVWISYIGPTNWGQFQALKN